MAAMFLPDGLDSLRMAITSCKDDCALRVAVVAASPLGRVQNRPGAAHQLVGLLGSLALFS